MSTYRLLSTRHHSDGSVEPPSTLSIVAPDDGEAVAMARRIPEGFVAADADFAWLVDEAGRVVVSFPVVFSQLGQADTVRSAHAG